MVVFLIPGLRTITALICLTAMPAFPQTAASPVKPVVTKAFRFTQVEARQIKIGESAPALHWVIPQLPRVEEILLVETPELRQRIVELFDAMRAEPQARHEWVLDPGTPWSLYDEVLRKHVPEFNIVWLAPDDLRRKPAAVQAPSAREVTFQVKAVPLPLLTSIQIRAETQAFMTAQSSGQGVVVTPQQPLSVLAKRFHLDSPYGESPAATLILAYAESEAESSTAAVVEGALVRVAVEAARVIVGRGFRLGQTQPAADAATRARSAVENLFSLRAWPKLAWPEPDGRFTYSEKTPEERLLSIRNLKTACAAKIVVGVGEEVGRGDRNKKRLEEKARLIQERLNERYAMDLSRLARSVPLAETVASVVATVGAASEIERAITPVAEGCNLLLGAKPRWTIQTLALSGGFGFSPEESVTGKGTIAGDNLLRLGESESLDAVLGPQVQKGSAWVRRSWSAAESSRFALRIGGDYLRDTEQQFGNPLGPAYEARDFSFFPRLTYTFSPALGAADEGRTGRGRFGLEAEGGFELRNVTVLRGPTGPGPSGATTSAAGRLRPVWLYQRFDLTTPGLGVFRTAAQVAGRRAFSWGDFTFNQVDVAAEIEATWGARRATDFLVRHRRGLGISNGDTPIFQLFRLGGATSVRGIEQGEFVGRRYAWEQSEAGFSIDFLISLFRGRQKDATPANGPAVVKGMDLAGIYVKGLYDRGFARNAATTGQLTAVSGSAHAWGAAVEIASLPVGSKRAALTIGWAHSSSSVLHHRGVIFTGISIDP